VNQASGQWSVGRVQRWAGGIGLALAIGVFRWGRWSLHADATRQTVLRERAQPGWFPAWRLAQSLAGLQYKAALNRLSIPSRLILLVLGLALPLNLVIAGVVWGLVSRANEIQRTSLLYAARSIAAGVDAELGKYLALGEALSRSPALLDDNLDAFEVEARRAFPAGGSSSLM
jgi:hypothetical protein